MAGVSLAMIFYFILPKNLSLWSASSLFGGKICAGEKAGGFWVQIS
jgi:hypothetical protein